MNKKSLILVILLFITIVVGMLVFTYLKKNEMIVPLSTNLAMEPIQNSSY